MEQTESKESIEGAFAPKVDRELRVYLRKPTQKEIDLVYKEVVNYKDSTVLLNVIMTLICAVALIGTVIAVAGFKSTADRLGGIIFGLVPCVLTLAFLGKALKSMLNKKEKLENIQNGNMLVTNCTVCKVLLGNASRENLRGAYMIEVDGRYRSVRAYDIVPSNSLIQVGHKCIYVNIFNKYGEEFEQFLCDNQGLNVLTSEIKVETGDIKDKQTYEKELKSEDSSIYYYRLKGFRSPTTEEHDRLCKALLKALSKGRYENIFLMVAGLFGVLFSVGNMMTSIGVERLAQLLFFSFLFLFCTSVFIKTEKERKGLRSKEYKILECEVFDYTHELVASKRSGGKDKAYIRTLDGTQVKNSFDMFDSNGTIIKFYGNVIAGMKCRGYLVDNGSIPRVILKDMTIKQLREMYKNEI